MRRWKKLIMKIKNGLSQDQTKLHFGVIVYPHPLFYESGSVKEKKEIINTKKEGLLIANLRGK